MDAAGDIRAAAARELDALLAVVDARLAARGQPPLPSPRLCFFDHRLDAGRAVPAERKGQGGTIELNLIYLRRHRRAMLTETLPHELAHLVVFHLDPKRRQPPHGTLWREVMRDWFGVEPQRTHRFDTEGVRSRRQRRWPYRCGCGDHALTTVRHRRIQRGAIYLCRRCHAALEPIRAD